MSCFFIILIEIDINKAILLGNSLPGLIHDQCQRQPDYMKRRITKGRKSHLIQPQLHKKPFVSKELFVKKFSLCFLIAKGHQILQRDMPADPPGDINIPGIDLINHRTIKSKCWPIIIAYRQCPVPCVAGTKI